jgi:hypothetical protein
MERKSSEKQSCSTCRQEESIEKLMTKFQEKVESFWKLMWYMLSSIEKKRLHGAGLHPSSIDSRCNDARLHKFGSRAQTARNRKEQRELGREGGANSGGFHRVARSSMG